MAFLGSCATSLTLEGNEVGFLDGDIVGDEEGCTDGDILGFIVGLCKHIRQKYGDVGNTQTKVLSMKRKLDWTHHSRQRRGLLCQGRGGRRC